MQETVAVLLSHACTAATKHPSLVAAAALALYGAANTPLLQASFCAADERAGSALAVLRALHAAFKACGLEDGLLRGAVGVRLALLLEDCGELEEARAVSWQVK